MGKEYIKTIDRIIELTNNKNGIISMNRELQQHDGYCSLIRLMRIDGSFETMATGDASILFKINNTARVSIHFNVVENIEINIKEDKDIAIGICLNDNTRYSIIIRD